MHDCPEQRASVGARIEQARIAAGFLTRAGFSRAVGVQPNTVYRWETGALMPDIFRLASIARVTRVSTDWLLRGERVDGTAVLIAWRTTARGRLASDGAMRFLEALPLNGYTPTPAFYDLALFAFEQGLSPEEAALGARLTESVRDRSPSDS